MSSSSLPLCVDLDGTLVNTDTFDEGVANTLRSPTTLLRLITQLPTGKARTKAMLAHTAPPDATTLPYNRPFLDWVRAQKAAGRYIVLVTAANETIAHQVAKHLDLFDEVLASTPARNLRGDAKGRALVERFGEQQFVYAGNDATDLRVWPLGAAAILVNAPRRLERALGELPIEATFPGPRCRIDSAALRPMHAAKSLISLLPLILLPTTGFAPLSVLTALASIVVLFSGLYLLGGLLVLSADRRRRTPVRILTGTHGVRVTFALAAVFISAGWLATAAAAGCLIPTLIILTFVLYVGWLQHQTLTAIMGLAALYLLRLLLGCTVFAVPLTLNLGITAGLICLVVGFLGHRGLTAIDET